MVCGCLGTNTGLLGIRIMVGEGSPMWLARRWLQILSGWRQGGGGGVGAVLGGKGCSGCLVEGGGKGYRP